MIIYPDHDFFLDGQFTTHAEAGEQIARQGDRIVWLKESEMKSLNAQKLSLESIAEIAKNVGSTRLSIDESAVLTNNLKWINNKIKSHNEAIKENKSHRIQTLDDKIKIISDNLSQSQDLLKQYEGKSYVTENGLAGRVDQMTEQEKETVMRLLFLFHKETCQDIQSNPALRQIVIEQLKKSPDEFARQAEKALLKMDELGEHIPLDGLLKVLLFAEKNRTLMAEGKIGEVARSRPEIRKIKADTFKIPYNIEYDTKSGDMVIVIGKLKPGGFKTTIKKRLLLENLDIDVLGKQAKTVLAEREVMFMREAEGLPHVATLHQVTSYQSQKKGKEVLVISMPFYRRGELLDYLLEHPLSDLEKYQILSDVIKGLRGLHSRGIIHRDIKPDNIFLDPEMENGKPTLRAKVGDFGLACFSKDDPDREKISGSPPYIPPEVLQRGRPATFASDAWSLGVLASAIMKLEIPFDGTNQEIAKAQKQWGNPFLNPKPQDENSIEYVIWKLLQIVPDQRMDLAEAQRIVDAHLANAKQAAASSI